MPRTTTAREVPPTARKATRGAAPDPSKRRFWRLLLLFIGLWAFFLVLGSQIDSMPYSLATEHRDGGQRPWLIALVMKILTWTWSNALFLASFAALAGQLTRVLSSEQVVPNYGGALGWGFGVYLLALVRPYVTTQSIPVQVSQSTYIVIAAFVSFLAFVMGYFPEYFPDLLRKGVHRLFGRESGPRGA